MERDPQPSPSLDSDADAKRVSATLQVPSRRYLARDAPLATSVLRAVNVFLFFGFAFPPIAIFVDFALVLVLAFLITSPARNEVGSLWFSVLVTGLVFIAAQVLGLKILGPLTLRINRLIDGAPAFGTLGGLQKHILRTTLSCSRELRFELDESDAETMNALARLSGQQTEADIKRRFWEVSRSESTGGDEDGNDLSEDDLEKKWRRIWEHEILGYRVGTATLRDALGPPSYAASIVPLRLVSVRAFLLPAFKVFQIALVILIFRVVTGSGSLLTVLQVGIALSFLMSMLIYLNHTKSLGSIEILDPTKFGVEVSEDFAAEQQELIGQTIIPARISVTGEYFAAIAHYFARNLAVFGLFNSAVLLIVTAFGLIISLAVAWGSRDATLQWYGEFALGVVLIPVGMLVLHYLASVLVQRVRQLAAVALGAILTGLVPIGIDYLVSGTVSGATLPLVSSVAAAVVGALAAAVGTAFSNRLSSPPAPVPSPTP